MGAVLIAGAAIWGVGWVTKTPVQLRLAGLGLLYLAVLALHVLLPDGAALREATGGSATPWLILGWLAVLVWVYRVWLTGLRARAAPATDGAAAEAPGGAELDRNARHIVLREIGGAGQQRLKKARVLVIGAGGLGSPVLSYSGRWRSWHHRGDRRRCR